jgi:DNA-binding PadR family transcriptional regulator
MKPAVFHILLALAEEEHYGYSLMQAVRDGSGGGMSIGTGSFYRHLTKLIDGGLVAESTVPRPGDDPRRGAYYRLTALGQRVLGEERHRLARLVAAIDDVRPVSHVSRKRHA